MYVQDGTDDSPGNGGHGGQYTRNSITASAQLTRSQITGASGTPGTAGNFSFATVPDARLVKITGQHIYKGKVGVIGEDKCYQDGWVWVDFLCDGNGTYVQQSNTLPVITVLFENVQMGDTVVFDEPGCGVREGLVMGYDNSVNGTVDVTVPYVGQYCLQRNHPMRILRNVSLPIQHIQQQVDRKFFTAMDNAVMRKSNSPINGKLPTDVDGDLTLMSCHLRSSMENNYWEQGTDYYGGRYNYRKIVQGQVVYVSLPDGVHKGKVRGFIPSTHTIAIDVDTRVSPGHVIALDPEFVYGSEDEAERHWAYRFHDYVTAPQITVRCKSCNTVYYKGPPVTNLEIDALHLCSEVDGEYTSVTLSKQKGVQYIDPTEPLEI